jgi:hypothetical protein
VILALTVLAIFVFAALVLVILFCGWLVMATNDAKSMRDFAVVLRAMPKPTVTINVRRKERDSP